MTRADHPPKLVALLEALAEDIGLEGDAADLLDGAPLELEDTIFVFEAGAQKESARFLPSLFCDLGMIPAGRERDFYAMLLTLQTDLFVMVGQSLSLSPSTGHVLLRQSINPAELTSKSLLALLTALVPIVKEWRAETGMLV